MKDFLDKNRILLGALALTLIAGLVVIAQRWGVEAENKTYDVVLDYSELELLAEQSEHDDGASPALWKNPPWPSPPP